MLALTFLRASCPTFRGDGQGSSIPTMRRTLTLSRRLMLSSIRVGPPSSQRFRDMWVCYVCGCSHPQELHGCLCRHSGMCVLCLLIQSSVRVGPPSSQKFRDMRVFYVCGCCHGWELHGCLCRYSGMCECFVFIDTIISKSGTTIIAEIQGYASVLCVWMLSWMRIAWLSL